MAGGEWAARPSRSGRPPDAGQAVLLSLIGVVLIAVVAVAVGSVGHRMAQRATAQTAADAAALAGVEGGRVDAGAAAGRNGAVLEAFERVGDGAAFTVTVEVSVGSEHAVARASSDP